MKFIAAKHFQSLRPVDDIGTAALGKLGHGELVTVEIVKSRNIRHHRMFWALMTIVHENIDGDRYPTVEDLVAAVKISAGHRTQIELPGGQIGFIPRSIAFHKMDQTEFSAFYDRVCDLIAKHFLPGVNVADLRSEVEHMIGLAKAS
jgi:hypothetical protein